MKNQEKKKKLLQEYNVDKYLAYAESDEAYAILFVKKYLKSSIGCWVDIIDYHCPNHYEPNNLQFKKIVCDIFPRTIKPKYPKKEKFESNEDYYFVCRAITYDTAHNDINKQKRSGVKGKRFVVEGVRYLDKTKVRPPFFRSSAPKEIKALAKNLNDRTDPLWDKALLYINKDYVNFDPYNFKIIDIKRI